MEHLIELARRLGKQIAAHERTTLLKKAQEEVKADSEATALIEEYHKQVEKIRNLEAQKKPIEPEDKHKLSDVEERIGTNVNLAELTRRQADFMEMMQKVKSAIDGELQF